MILALNDKELLSRQKLVMYLANDYCEMKTNKI